MQRFVTYYRVSTQRQGRSGLGLEAQQAAVTAFLAGRDAQVIGEYREIESGRKSDRQQLAAAMLMCRMTGSVLLIAKLDRLARDAHFLLGLEKSGVEFLAADMPFANRLTIGIMALVAEEEAKAISARTKAALAARKARGLPLGNRASLRPADRQRAATAAAAWSKKAAAHAAMVLPAVQEMQRSGLSLRATARELARRGFTTVTGGQWTASQVSAVLRRQMDEATAAARAAKEG
ncbi:recombinase family protein (plasmid) [Skermanella sp. TT6]|uniref:Recombinase family protein n=1 Tax=Skermanella cutis TaxID=2775420 RepID=A0ABX7BI67_9PROT|nr:recombinase family protein [Skermanella sp. TT6]QQP94064.1 recombinase family protein [Skermanella sp. TT6]